MQERGKCPWMREYTKRKSLSWLTSYTPSSNLQRNEAFQTDGPEDPALWGAAQTKQRKPRLWGNDRLRALSLQGWEHSHCQDRDIVSKKRQPCKQVKPLFLITTFNHGNITSKSLQKNAKLRDSYSNPVFSTCDCIHNVTGNFTSNNKADASSLQPQCLILTFWEGKAGC